MGANSKIIFIFPVVLMLGCNKWDPNQQFSEETIEIEKVKLAKKKHVQHESLKELRLGQTFSDVVMVYGKDYKILASLIENDERWLKIEYEKNDNIGSPSNRIELVFKNNRLIKIHKN
jgi:hypothetical protein